MSCPANASAPAGYRVLRGTVSPALTAWAISLLKNIASYQYGDTFTMGTYVARVDHHTWTYRNGVLVTGLCIPGITIYEPRPQGDFGLAPGDPLVTPDPLAAVYDNGPADQVDWPTVGLTTGAIVVVVGLFLWGLKHAGRAAT